MQTGILLNLQPVENGCSVCCVESSTVNICTSVSESPRNCTIFPAHKTK